MKKILFAVAVVSSMMLVGCGGDQCAATPAKSICEADPVPVALTGDALAKCQADAKTPPKCYAESKKYSDCLIKNTVCGADKKTDFAATNAKCTAEAKASTDCKP